MPPECREGLPILKFLAGLCPPWGRSLLSRRERLEARSGLVRLVLPVGLPHQQALSRRDCRSAPEGLKFLESLCLPSGRWGRYFLAALPGLANPSPRSIRCHPLGLVLRSLLWLLEARLAQGR